MMHYLLILTLKLRWGPKAVAYITMHPFASIHFKLYLQVMFFNVFQTVNHNLILSDIVTSMKLVFFLVENIIPNIAILLTTTPTSKFIKFRNSPSMSNWPITHHSGSRAWRNGSH